jgi:hypothetical protein
MSEEAKAIQEIAKTTNTAIHAVEKMGKFISDVAGVPIATAVGIFEDKLRYIRWENQLNLIQKAHEKLAQRGLSTPTRFLLSGVNYLVRSATTMMAGWVVLLFAL